MICVSIWFDFFFYLITSFFCRVWAIPRLVSSYFTRRSFIKLIHFVLNCTLFSARKFPIEWCFLFIFNYILTFSFWASSGWKKHNSRDTLSWDVFYTTTLNILYLIDSCFFSTIAFLNILIKMCLYYLSLEKDQSIFFQNDISFFSADGWATAIEVGFFLHAIHRKCIIAIFKHFTL
jgi:hypothetical protein